MRFKDRMYDLYLDDSVATLMFESWKPESQHNQELIEHSHFRIGIMYDFMESNLEKPTGTNGEEFTHSD